MKAFNVRVIREYLYSRNRDATLRLSQRGRTPRAIDLLVSIIVIARCCKRSRRKRLSLEVPSHIGLAYSNVQYVHRRQLGEMEAKSVLRQAL